MDQLVKLLVELGPLAVFFLVNSGYGIFAATGAFMAATVVSLIASRLLFGKVAAMPLVTGVFVLIFGGLTLYLHNDTFIKMKPTIVNLLFASLLLGGLLAGRLWLKWLLGDVFAMREEGWHRLTLRWGIFFLFLAGLNEIVWRNFSTDAWVNFKVFGIMPLTMLFGILQVNLLQKYQIEDQTSDSKPK